MEQSQLVLQFAADGVADFDRLMVLEARLVEVLGEEAVDGHDFGSGEMNIFILTDAPEASFNVCLLEVTQVGLPLRGAAHRIFGGEEDYKRIWPVGSPEPFEVI